MAVENNNIEIVKLLLERKEISINASAGKIRYFDEI